MKRLSYILCLLFSLALAAPALATKVYQWTDSEGVTHFGPQPPPGVEAKEIRPRTGHSEPVHYPSAQPQAPGSTPAPSLEGTRAYTPDPERCAVARSNLEILRSTAHVSRTNEQGEEEFLSLAEREQQIAEMQRVISRDCVD